MKNITKLTFITLAMLSLLSCGSKKIPRDLGELEKKIELSKGPCYGNCPVFTLTIYEGGVLEYHGIQNVEKNGYFIRKMEKKGYKELLQAFEEAQMSQYEDYYPNPVVDFPTYKLTFLEKSVAGNQRMPEPLVKLIKELDKLALSGEWEAK
jgi:hypothetical protein